MVVAAQDTDRPADTGPTTLSTDEANSDPLPRLAGHTSDQRGQVVWRLSPS